LAGILAGAALGGYLGWRLTEGWPYPRNANIPILGWCVGVIVGVCYTGERLRRSVFAGAVAGAVVGLALAGGQAVEHDLDLELIRRHDPLFPLRASAAIASGLAAGLVVGLVLEVVCRYLSTDQPRTERTTGPMKAAGGFLACFGISLLAVVCYYLLCACLLPPALLT
jgi:hypothetical protein